MNMIYPTKDCKYDVGVFCNNFHEIEAELVRMDKIISVGPRITNECSGETIVLTDSVEAKLLGLSLRGKSEQNGTPTPDSPQEIISVGNSGSVEVHIDDQTITFATPNGLPGIKVTNPDIATYTDESGRMWCADEIDFKRGVYVQRIAKYKFTGSEKWWAHSGKTDGSEGFFVMIDIGQSRLAGNHGIFTHFTRSWGGDGAVAFVGEDSLQVMARTLFTSTDAVKEFFKTNDSYVLYILATPIETPLSEEEIAKYKDLHTNYPTTTVTNDGGANMEIEYVADTKAYIDRKFEELKVVLEV